MMRLQKLSYKDGMDVFEMLKGIRSNEHNFTNPTCGMTFAEFQDWLIQQEQWSNGKMLPDGYVPQTTYWLYDGETPVGMGKIRHQLSDVSRRAGGNIGYAVSALYRGRGYGKALLRLLLSKAREMGIEEILLTVDKDNEPSRRICEENGGRLKAETAGRYYFTF